MNYITPSGSYYEGDKAHLNDMECAKRPEGYLFTGTVSLDPQVMWRPLTAQPALYSTVNQFKQAAVAAYWAKL